MALHISACTNESLENLGCFLNLSHPGIWLAGGMVYDDSVLQSPLPPLVMPEVDQRFSEAYKVRVIEANSHWWQPCRRYSLGTRPSEKSKRGSER